ncbi:baeRF2 domain-containing protein [Streptomyces lydicus]|uniref:baeRF2 domain-containing protein n=1 Tax=Streptomyces lydicus TaxID=47763 RepID=UPI0037ACBA5B
MNTSRGTHDADKQIELRWRAARRSLSEQGAAEADLAVLDDVVGGAPDLPGPQGEALFVSGGRLLGAFTLAEPPAADSAQAADDVRAAVVLVAGDPKAVGLLREHLAARQSDAEVVYIEGGRTDDSAREALRASVDAAMHEVMASRHRAVLERLEAELTGGRALQGIPAVKEALAEGRVETLLLAADRGADPVLFASRRDPRALGTDPAALGEDSTAFSASAAPLLLRSAVLGGASFTEILPPTRCTDGVAALLRY